MAERYGDSTTEEIRRLERLLYGTHVNPTKEDIGRSIDFLQRKWATEREGVPGQYEGSNLQKIIDYLRRGPSFDRPGFVADTPEKRREILTETIKHPIGAGISAAGALFSSDPAKVMFGMESMPPAAIRAGIEAAKGERSFGASYREASERARGGVPVTYGDVALAAIPDNPVASALAGGATGAGLGAKVGGFFGPGGALIGGVGGALLGAKGGRGLAAGTAAFTGGVYLSPFNTAGVMSLTGKGLALKRWQESGRSLEQMLEIANADRATNLARGIAPHIDDAARGVKKILETEGEAGLVIPATNAGKIKAGQMEMGGFYPTRNPLNPFAPDAPINFSGPEWQRKLEGAIVEPIEKGIRRVRRVGPVSSALRMVDPNAILPSEVNPEITKKVLGPLNRERFTARGRAASIPARITKEIMYDKEPTETFARLRYRASLGRPVTTAEDLDVAGRLIEERFKSINPQDHADNILHIFGTTDDDVLAAMVWEPAHALEMEQSLIDIQKGIEVMDRALAAAPNDPELLAARQSLGHWYSRLEGAAARLPETEHGFLPHTKQPIEPYPPTLEELGGEMSKTDKQIQAFHVKLREITKRGELALKRFNAAAGNPEAMQAEMENYGTFLKQQDLIATRLQRLEAERGNLTAAQGAREQLEQEAKDLIDTHHKGELVNSPAREVLPEVTKEIEQADKMAMKYAETNRSDAARFASKANMLRSETIAERAARLSGGDPVREERLLSEYLAGAGSKIGQMTQEELDKKIKTIFKKHGIEADIAPTYVPETIDESLYGPSDTGEGISKMRSGPSRQSDHNLRLSWGDDGRVMDFEIRRRPDGSLYATNNTIATYGKQKVDALISDLSPYVKNVDMNIEQWDRAYTMRLGSIEPPKSNETYKPRFPERADGSIVLPDPNTYKGQVPKKPPAPMKPPTPKQIEEMLKNDESFMDMVRRYSTNADGTIDPKKVKESLELVADNAAARNNIARELSNEVIRSTPNQRRIAGLIRGFFDDYVHAQVEAGTLSESLDNYLKHMIDNGNMRGRGIGTLKGQLIPKPSHTKRRVSTLGSTIHELAETYARTGSSKSMNKDILNLLGIYSKQAEHQMGLKRAAETIMNSVGVPIEGEAVSQTNRLRPRAALMAKNGATKDEIHRANMMDRVWKWKDSFGGEDGLRKEVEGFMRNSDPDNLSFQFRKAINGKAQGMTIEQTLDSNLGGDLSHLSKEEIQQAFESLTDPNFGELATLKALENSGRYMPTGMYIGRFGLDNLAAMTADELGPNGAAILEQVKAWAQAAGPGKYHLSVPDELIPEFEALATQGKVNAWLIPKQVQDRLDRYIFDYSARNLTPGQTNDFMRVLEGVRGFYSRTTILPWTSTQLQNLIGGYYNTVVFGGMNLENDAKAIKILLGDRSRVWTNAFGEQRTGQQIIEELEHKGALDFGFFSKQTLDEAIKEDSKHGRFFTRIAESPVDIGAKVFTSIENKMKFSFGFDQWMKGLDFDHAADNVRAMMFDYADLTKEQKAARTFIPFLTFPMKQIPLTLREFAHRPYLMSLDYKLQDALQLVTGQEFTGDELAGMDPYTARSFPIKVGERDGLTVKYNLGNLSPNQPVRELNPFGGEEQLDRAISSAFGMIAPYYTRLHNLAGSRYDFVRRRSLGPKGSRKDVLGISLPVAQAHFLSFARGIHAADDIAFSQDVDEDTKKSLLRRLGEGLTGIHFGEYDAEAGVERNQQALERRAAEEQRSLQKREDSTAIFGPPSDADWENAYRRAEEAMDAFEAMRDLPSRYSRPSKEPVKPTKRYQYKIRRY